MIQFVEWRLFVPPNPNVCVLTHKRTTAKVVNLFGLTLFSSGPLRPRRSCQWIQTHGHPGDHQAPRFCRNPQVLHHGLRQGLPLLFAADAGREIPQRAPFAVCRCRCASRSKPSCTTCIGNSGDLRPELNAAINQNDLVCAAVGQGSGGKNVYLADIWPSSDEIQALMQFAMNGRAHQQNYARIATEPGELWERIKGVAGTTHSWPKSTYIAEPPYFSISL